MYIYIVSMVKILQPVSCIIFARHTFVTTLQYYSIAGTVLYDLDLSSGINIFYKEYC